MVRAKAVIEYEQSSDLARQVYDDTLFMADRAQYILLTNRYRIAKLLSPHKPISSCLQNQHPYHGNEHYTDKTGAVFQCEDVPSQLPATLAAAMMAAMCHHTWPVAANRIIAVMFVDVLSSFAAALAFRKS